MIFYDSLGVFGSIFGDFDFFGVLVHPCSPRSRCPIIETFQNRRKTRKIRQNTCFWHQNAPNSCQKVVETPIIHAQNIFLRFASDSGRFLDTLTPFRRFENRYFFIIFGEKTVFGLSEIRENAKKKKKKKRNGQKCPPAHFECPYVKIG